MLLTLLIPYSFATAYDVGSIAYTGFYFLIINSGDGSSSSSIAS